MSGDEADALRRRLYAPDVSADDIARYAASGAGAPATPPPPAAAEVAVAVSVEEAPAPAASARARRRTLIVSLAVVVVVVAGIGIAVRVGQAERLDGIRAPTTVSSAAVDRAAFEQNLDVGNAAGIAAYLVTHRSPKALSHASRFFTIEQMGTGTHDIDLAPVPADAVSGRATVFLVVGGDASAAWTTYRRRVDPTGEQQYVRQVARGGEQSAGVLTSTTFRYSAGDRPVRLVVDVDDGVRWGVAVVFSD